MWVRIRIDVEMTLNNPGAVDLHLICSEEDEPPSKQNLEDELLRLRELAAAYDKKIANFCKSNDLRQYFDPAGHEDGCFLYRSFYRQVRERLFGFIPKTGEELVAIFYSEPVVAINGGNAGLVYSGLNISTFDSDYADKFLGLAAECQELLGEGFKIDMS